MKKLKKEYKYMVSTKSWQSVFSDLQSAKDIASKVRSDDVSIWVLSNDYCDTVGLYGRDFDGTYEEDEPVLNDKELLEKCKTNQPITDGDIKEHTDSDAILHSWGEALCKTVIAGSISLSDDSETKNKPHVCTQEELDKLKMLQRCKERDLLTIQSYHNLGHSESQYKVYRVLRDKIKQYDKYMYAIKTGHISDVNLELVTPMGIIEEEKPKKSVESNKKEVKPYDSLLDDEKAERINKCLNKL